MSVGDWLTALGFTLWIPYVILIVTDYKYRLRVYLLGVVTFLILTVSYVMTHDEPMALLTSAILALNCHDPVKLIRKRLRRNERQ